MAGAFPMALGAPSTSRIADGKMAKKERSTEHSQAHCSQQAMCNNIYDIISIFVDSLQA